MAPISSSHSAARLPNSASHSGSGGGSDSNLRNLRKSSEHSSRFAYASKHSSRFAYAFILRSFGGRGPSVPNLTDSWVKLRLRRKTRVSGSSFQLSSRLSSLSSQSFMRYNHDSLICFHLCTFKKRKSVNAVSLVKIGTSLDIVNANHSVTACCMAFFFFCLWDFWKDR